MASEMKLNTRLSVAFGLMILFIILIGAVGVTNITSLGTDVEDMARDKFPKTVWANNIIDAENVIALAMRNITLFEDPQIQAEQFDKIDAAKAKIKANVARLDATITTAAGKDALQALQDARTAFIADVDRFIELAQSNRMVPARGMLLGDLSQSQQAYTSAIVDLIDYQVKLMNEAGTAAGERVGFASTVIIGAGVIALLIALAISFWIVRTVMRQLGGDPSEAAARVNEIAKGNIDTPIVLRRGDERSLLASLKRMQEVINDFVNGQLSLAQKHQEGSIWETMDSERYPGVYGSMASEVNSLVRGHIDTKMQIVDVITAYSKGDFSSDMPELPGDKAKITEAVDGVKQGLVGVSHEIKAIASAGSEGDFSKRGDSDRYAFMFREMIEDLNQLMENCEVGFNDVMRVSKAMAEGDLTQTITKDYPGVFGETKGTINNTVSKLQELVGTIKQSAESITTASREIASGNQDLSQRTEQAATSLQETASSMEELTATVKQNADNANQANSLAVSASEVADQGGKVVRSSVATMEEIAEFSNKMSDIIGVIDSIAFQTNILALNASVEAARAGDQGRGFAVVATEVRNLAQRTANAAKEIKELITESVEKVGTGSSQIAEAGTRMDEIVASIKRVTDLVGEISAASKEQTYGIEQVNVATTEMEEVAQQNSALVEEAAAAAGSLDEQAQNLVAAVAVFKLDQEAANGSPQPVHSNRDSTARASNAIAPAKPAAQVHPIRPESPAKRPAKKVAAGGGEPEWVEF